VTQGEEKHDHWGLIYSGGFFIGIAQDMIIRSSTDNKKSIDDVMRTLFKKYGGTANGYNLEELQYLMSEASGSDQTEFFNRYIKGVERIPLGDYLKLGGFSAIEENGKISIVIKENRNAKEKQMNEGLFGVK
jgi:predicted metalloprotease with PDZ domain